MIPIPPAKLAHPAVIDMIGTLRGWLAPVQIQNIQKAIDDGRLTEEEFLAVSDIYVWERLDNGGFTPRDQYVMSFAFTPPAKQPPAPTGAPTP